jgi:hypothetical protein
MRLLTSVSSDTSDAGGPQNKLNNETRNLFNYAFQLLKLLSNELEEASVYCNFLSYMNLQVCGVKVRDGDSSEIKTKWLEIT